MYGKEGGMYLSIVSDPVRQSPGKSYRGVAVDIVVFELLDRATGAALEERLAALSGHIVTRSGLCGAGCRCKG